MRQDRDPQTIDEVVDLKARLENEESSEENRDLVLVGFLSNAYPTKRSQDN